MSSRATWNSDLEQAARRATARGPHYLYCPLLTVPGYFHGKYSLLASIIAGIRIFKLGLIMNNACKWERIIFHYTHYYALPSGSLLAVLLGFIAHVQSSVMDESQYCNSQCDFGVTQLEIIIAVDDAVVGYSSLIREYNKHCKKFLKIQTQLILNF